jgi:hypothetical protein
MHLGKPLETTTHFHSAFASVNLFENQKVSLIFDYNPHLVVPA